MFDPRGSSLHLVQCHPNHILGKPRYSEYLSTITKDFRSRKAKLAFKPFANRKKNVRLRPAIIPAFEWCWSLIPNTSGTASTAITAASLYSEPIFGVLNHHKTSLPIHQTPSLRHYRKHNSRIETNQLSTHLWGVRTTPLKNQLHSENHQTYHDSPPSRMQTSTVSHEVARSSALSWPFRQGKETIQQNLRSPV